MKKWTSLLRIVALLLLFAPAVQPLVRADFTCGYDNVFHLWRAVQIDHLWSHGVFFSRWAPDMAHGFGFPLFSFMPPGSALMAAALHRTGLAWPVALNALFALSIVASGLLMFWLARELFGPYAGVIAAVAYVYAPFRAYDVFNRGGLSSSVAWVFPPLVLWAVQRWGVQRERRFLLAGAVGMAGLLLTHQLVAFLYAPLLVAWVLVAAYLARDWRVVWRGALLGALGMGLAAFFWLPSLLERPWVQLDRVMGTWVFDYHYNFLTLDHLLALPRAADPNLINDWPQKALALVPVLIALLPLMRWPSYQRVTRWRIAAVWLVLAGYMFLVLPPSVWLWERVPLLPYVQFPWRYLGPASCCVALLAGAVVADAGHAPRTLPRWMASLLPLGLVLAVIAANLGWFFPATCAAPSEISPAAMIAWERMSDTVGTTAKGEFLPIWAASLPDDGALDAAYVRGEPPVRLPEGSLPSGAVVTRAAYGALRAAIDVETPEAFRARYLAFYYPGWQAAIDGAPVPVSPEPGTGLVTFDVPAGAHRIEVWFGETPLRLAADGISVVSLVVLGLLLLTRRRLEREEPSPVAGFQLGTGATLVLLLAGTAVVAGKVFVVDRQPVLWRRTRLQVDGTLAQMAHPAAANFDDRARFLGYDGLPDTFHAGDAPVITLYWRALEPGAGDWHVGLTLVGADGARWPVTDLRPARWGRNPPPLAEWPRDGYARMDYHVDVTPGMPAGTYALALALFDRKTLEPASVLGTDGNPVGPELVIGQVSILPPVTPPTLASLDVPDGALLRRCGELGLWSMAVDRAQAAPGDLVTLHWVWEAAFDPPASVLAAVKLADASGAVVRTWNVAPSASWWPTDAWSEGQRWVGQPVLRLPGSLQSGDYVLSAGLPGCDGLASVDVRVVAPERRWNVPDGFTLVDGAVLGDVVRLAGYSVFPREVVAGDAVQVQLAWQAVAEMETAYRVFVHVVDGEGRLLAQDDGEPVTWTRPTPGWAVGEVVVDSREVAVPGEVAAGAYEIRVGLYVPGGARLLLPTGGDAIALGVLRVP